MTTPVASYEPYARYRTGRGWSYRTPSRRRRNHHQASNPSARSWPKQGVMRYGHVYTAPTRETTSSAQSNTPTAPPGLPTPLARDGKHGPTNPDARRTHGQQVNLPDAIAGISRTSPADPGSTAAATVHEAATAPPTTTRVSACGTLCDTGLLGDARLMPTPRASDGAKGCPRQRGSRGDLMLPSAVTRLLPTPTTADGTGGHRSRSANRRHELLLPGIATQITAPFSVVRGSGRRTWNPHPAAGIQSPRGGADR